MNRILFFFAICSMAHVASAQDSLRVDLTTRTISADSIEVILHFGSLGDSLNVPVWAFEFKVSVSHNVRFLGITSTSTLSAKDGWTTAANVENNWVGGFASSRNAIETGGTLVALYFSPTAGKNDPEICLSGIRLNSGNPGALPSDLCTTHKWK